MQDIQLLLEQYGAWLVFGNVLIEQAGLPVPAYPMLIAAGALAGTAGWLAPWIAATLACLLADSLWYLAGRRYGSRLLGVVCKLSLSQDSCIRQTQRLYLRVGARAAGVQVLPGAGALSTVMAGLTGTGLRRFLLYDLVGAMIWAGSALLLGGLFHGVVNDVLDLLANYGAMGLGLLAALLALYIVVRALRRWVLVRKLRVIPRLSVDELMRWRQDGRQALVFDVRPEAQRDAQRIPGAIAVDLRARAAAAGGGRAGRRHRGLLRLPQRGLGRDAGPAAARRRLSPHLGAARRLRGLGAPRAALNASP